MNNKVVNKEPSAQRDSFTELLGQLAHNSAAVVHDEIELVIQGIREAVRAVRSGVLTVATGVAISFAAFMSLCAALPDPWSTRSPTLLWKFSVRPCC